MIKEVLKYLFIFCIFLQIYDDDVLFAVNNDSAQEAVYSITHDDINNVKPQWWENTLGTEQIIIPGYTPLRVRNSQIELYERVYSWSNGYFPDEIVSRSKTLVSDMRLIAHIDGKKVKLYPDDVKLFQQSDCMASVLASGEPIPGLHVSVNTIVEYDGVAITKINLEASRPIRLDGLDYEVILPDSPNLNVLGFKAKDIRKQKDRQDIILLPYFGEFYNVIGFADGDRSFWWFGDNAKGWIWNGSTVTEIYSDKQTICLKQKLIGDSWDIDGSMSFQINFLATPVRNTGGEWRSRRPITGLPDSKKTLQGDVFKLWWTDAFAHDAFPYTFYPEDTAKKIIEADLSAFPGQDHNVQLIQNDKQKYGTIWLPYFSAHVLSNIDPELQRNRKQWEILPEKVFKEVVGPYKEIFGKVVLTHNANTYSNYILWRMKEESDRLGFEGIYLDHGPPYDSNNEKNGGWIDSNGKLHSSLDILGLREFLKRLRVLFYKKGKPGYVFVHNSNREIMPAYTFAYSTIDGEQYRDGRVKEGDYLNTITLNEFRTRFSSPQFGVLCTFLPTVWTEHVKSDLTWKGSEKQRIAYRRLMALTLLHDVADWPKGAHEAERLKLLNVLDNFGIDKAVFKGYWNPDTVVNTTSSDIKISYYQRTDNFSYLFIVTNISEKAVATAVNFNEKRLGFEAKSIRLLCEGQEETVLTSSNPTHIITVPAKDFRWIVLKKK